MIILLFIISITMLIISIIFNKKGNEARKDTAGWFTSLIISSFATVICLMVTLGFTASVVKSKYIVEKITMYEQQNKQIEEQIDTVVKQYQEYESDTYIKTSSESSITLVSLYPDLKSDELVKEQIKVYQNNNKKITELKEEQISVKACKWWLYFGG
ncbi:MAG: hypothetical protein ACLRM7_01270 [Ruminococcus sp.]|nr:MAG TPA: cell division protein [Caudoviricetes sp.]